MLRGGYHKNKHLQCAWNKYSEGAFEFSVLVGLDVSEMLLRITEELYLYNMEPEYNVVLSAIRNPMLGKAHSKETRALIKKNNARLSGDKHPMWGRNHSDAAKRKIGLAARGEKNPSAKLTTLNVLEIRKLYQAGGVTQKELGRRFGVTKTTAGNIIRRKIWKHI